MPNKFDIFSKGERQVTTFWLAMWLLLTGALLLIANWEAARQLRERLNAFETQTLDLSEIAEQIIVGRMQRFDEALLVLRASLGADKHSIADSIKLLRSGPLADPELLIVLVDRNGYLAYTDAPGVPAKLYLGDRAYFRYFAEGGKDGFYVDEPSFGRTTRRHTLPLVRPVLDKDGGFLGVIAISIRQEALSNFGNRLMLSDNTRVTLISQTGAVVARSSEMTKVQGTRLSPEQLAPMLQGNQGVYSTQPDADGQAYSIAYQRLEGLPLIVFAESHPTELLSETTLQRNLIMLSAGFISLLVLLLILGLLQRRKVMTQYIATQQAHLQEAQRIAEMGSWELDLKIQTFKWSDEVYRLVGRETGTFDPTLENFLQLVTSDDRAAVHAEISKAIADGRGSIEFSLARDDGQIRRMLGRGEAVSNPEGQVVALIGTIRDVTDQRAAEHALMQSEALFRTLARVLPVGIFYTDSSGSGSYVNERYCEISGRTLEESLGTGWTDAIHPDDRARVCAEWNRATETGHAFFSEHRFVLPNGKEIWCLVQAEPETDAQGKTVCYVGSVTDISDHKRAVQMSYRLILRNQVLMQNALDGIHVLDQHGRLVEANPAFCKLLGYTPAEVQTLNVADWEAQMSSEQLQQSLAKLIDGGHAVIETVNRRKDGSLINVEISAVGLEIEGQKLLYAATRDITERKNVQQRLEGLVQQRTAELSTALQAAQIADQTKDAFLANITHELRTPLSAVIGFSNLARPLCSDPRQRDYLDKINSAGRTLSHVIDDLLDLSKIAAGHMELEIRPFSLRQVVMRSSSVISFKAEEKGLELSEQIDDEIPDVLAGDSLRLEQILLNLLSNAVKYTADGRVELRVALAAREAQRVCLDISVADTGIGLGPDEIALLFKPFSQTDASMTRKYGGTGLGLAICKHLAELMGGEISVTSEAGRGSTFRVRLWLGVATDELPAATEAEQEATRSHYVDAHVLVVDDQPFNRDIVNGLLTVVGITPHLAENGQEALDLLSMGTQSFDLVLMDIQMPIMDGLTATRVIRKLERFAELPIIAMTAHAMTHEREISIAAGMNDHIGKPFDEAGFYRTLAKWIPHGKQRAPSAAATRPEQATGLPSLPGVDTRAGLALLLGDEARYRHWLGDFVVEAPAAIGKIHQALSLGQPDAASLAAHTLKGRMGLLGMKQLHLHAATLEAAIDGSEPTDELLHRLELGIAAMCAEIQGQFDATDKARPAATRVPDKLPPGVPPASVTHLIARLDAGDSDSEALIMECLNELESTLWVPHLRQALGLIQSFDFSAAGRLLCAGREEPTQKE